MIKELKGIRSTEFGTDKSVQCEKVLLELQQKSNCDIDDIKNMIDPKNARILKEIAPNLFSKPIQVKKFG